MSEFLNDLQVLFYASAIVFGIGFLMWSVFIGLRRIRLAPKRYDDFGRDMKEMKWFWLISIIISLLVIAPFLRWR